MADTTHTYIPIAGREGLTLHAQLTQGGSTYGAPITTGFTDLGAGLYEFETDEIPDDFVGGILFYEAGSPAAILAAGNVKPGESATVIVSSGVSIQTE